MKRNFFTFLCLIFVTAPACSGAAVMNSNLTVIIPSAAVVNTVPSSMNNTSINPQTGCHKGLEALFNVKTNGDDSTYDFVISSSVNTNSGERSGYFLKDGDLYLIFGNKEILPDLASYGDISSLYPQSNKNLIAYPVIKNPEFQTDYQMYNGNMCCKFLSGGKQNFNVSQLVGNTPLAGTYSIEDDSAGIYEAVVMLNIYRKP